MIDKRLHQLVSELSKFNIIICFNGSFTQGIIEEIGEAIKGYMSGEEGTEEEKIYDVFSIYIEQSQNIKNYFHKALIEKKQELQRFSFESVLVIGIEDDHYYVCAGNVIFNGDIEMMKEKLDILNKLSESDVKKLYREKLRNKACDGFGAGLGLLEMKKKSKHKLEYCFSDRSEGHSFFTLKVTI